MIHVWVESPEVQSLSGIRRVRETHPNAEYEVTIVSNSKTMNAAQVPKSWLPSSQTGFMSTLEYVCTCACTDRR